MAGEILYKCEFCHAPFKSESRFLRHHCKEMKREEDFKSPTGQTAWLYYKTWMKQKHKAIVSSDSAFKKSKYFTTFFNFAKFVKRARIPDTDVFINLMVRCKIEPIYWTNDIAYGKYLEFLTRQASPKDMVKISVKTIIDIADAANVDEGRIFEILTPNEVIQLIQQRNLSPWLLLNSKKFANFVNDKTTSEEKIILESIISPDYWISRFKKEPKEVEIIRHYVKELDL